MKILIIYNSAKKTVIISEVNESEVTFRSSDKTVQMVWYSVSEAKKLVTKLKSEGYPDKEIEKIEDLY